MEEASFSMDLIQRFFAAVVEDAAKALASSL